MISRNNRWFWKFEKSEPKNHQFLESQRPKEPTRLHERTVKDPEGFTRLSDLKQSENCGHVEYHPGI